MRNINSELEDSMRANYKRSDFGEIVRGKYATTQVDFSELTALLLAVIGEDDGIKFIHHSIGNSLADHHPGDWTYEIDNANQVTLRYWLNSLGNISEEISTPPCVITPKERSELQNALLEGVSRLRTQVSAHNHD
jgi:hypothetical protein